ncbi:MAG: ATP-binding cassette domain-containing protein [Cyclobacteriaceae bacterium]|jgi:ABC-type multidrug transport system ATPase subunit/uncharacterized tellurite resistance protein B-like protein
MSEELLKAIVQLFAIVAKERISDEERGNIKEFLGQHLNQDATRYYLSLFDDFCKANQRMASAHLTNIDSETAQFVDDWAQIMQIAKKVNQALTMQQKAVLVAKIIELVVADGFMSDREENLIFYIGEALKFPPRDLKDLRSFVVGEDAQELSSRNVLIIDESPDEPEVYHGPHIQSRSLSGLIAILRLPDMNIFFIRYLGITPMFLNGIPLKSRKIDIFPTGSTIRGSKIEPVYYSDVTSKFLIEDQDAKVTFVAEHVFYHFKSGRAGLQNINLAEKGGKLIGLMGASGSGKSTLLNVLNGTEKPSSGSVVINGIDLHRNPEKLEGVIGFIPQDDLLIEDLTVFENLYYAARLCFGHYTRAQIGELVERVLISLGLIEIRNLKVGNPMNKTISGGQRKRVNVGLELLREPTILFVDEPTSGLSSRDSENIMDLLKELALRGKMIFVVIHQPSSDIFKMFDSLVILDVGGFQIYYGNPIEAVEYFQEVVNAANRTPGACPECGNINPEQIFNIIETRVVDEFGKLTHTRKTSPGQWYQYFKKKIRLLRIDMSTDELKATQKIPNALKQTWVFVVRDVLAKAANRQYVIINALLAPLLALFIAFFVKYYDALGATTSSYTFFHNDNIPVYFFMSVVVALFVGLIISAEEIFRDRKILKREKYLHLSRNSYLISKVVILFSISAVQTLLFIVVGNAILEIPMTEYRYWLILFSAACFANMLGLNISSAFDSAVTIYILIPILIIPQLLLSGVVISFDKFNPSVSRPKSVPLLGEFMASRWAFEAYMVTQFKDNPFEKPFYSIDQKQALAEYKRTYYIPKLESHLANVANNRSDWRQTDPQHAVNKSIRTLRSELEHEISRIGAGRYDELEKLVPGKFDSSAQVATARFLETLKRYYALRSTNAMAARDSLVRTLTGNQDALNRFQLLRLRYQNEAVTETVENKNKTRITEFEGEIVQKIFPIYFDDHRPSHLFDFKASFYVPTKHFAGRYYDTYYFNISIIWAMTIGLYLLLYFEVLKKIVHGLEMRRKYKRAVNV